MKVKLTLSFAKLLRSLLSAEVNRGDFRANQSILAQFVDDGVLDYRIIGKQQQKIFCPDALNLHLYLQNKFEIPSLQNCITFLETDDFERSDAVRASSDSKIRKTKVLQGFLINSFDSIVAQLNDQLLTIKPTPGAYTFIAEFEHFIVPDDVTIVVVENHENFREIERQRYLFQNINPLFVWRYQNITGVAEWLTLNRCPYLHFGDFDLKGIHIYLSEFKSKLVDNRGSFFIPDNIETLFETNGAKSLYEDQKFIMPSIMRYTLDEQVKKLLEIIQAKKCGLSQEILIRSDVA
jgi:hypothetical protein